MRGGPDELAVGDDGVAGGRADAEGEAGLVTGGVVGREPGHRADRLVDRHRPVAGADPALGAAVGVGVLRRLAVVGDDRGEATLLQRLGGCHDQLVPAAHERGRLLVDGHRGDLRAGEVEVEAAHLLAGDRPDADGRDRAVGRRGVVDRDVVGAHLVAAVAHRREQRVRLRGHERRGQHRPGEDAGHGQPQRAGAAGRRTAPVGGHLLTVGETGLFGRVFVVDAAPRV